MEKLKQAAKDQCELLASPYGHIMLPNFPYEDGKKSLEFTMEAYQKIFGFVPESGWNPECGWRADLPQMFKEAGFKNMILDWESLLISNNEEIKKFEVSDGPYGHHLPYYDVDPNDDMLHNPIKMLDGLTGLFRTDRCSNKFLFYIMAAMENHPLYKDIDDKTKKDHAITLEDILENTKYWSGKKKDGVLIIYADDAEYIGTTGYFLVKYFNKNEFFLENPSHGRMIEMIKGINEIDGGFTTVRSAVKEYPAIEGKDIYIEDDMAWHRSRSSNWAKTPTSLEWDPVCKDLSERLQKIEAQVPEDMKEKLKQAWFSLTNAENSDGRWPPPPQKPGDFNIEYCRKYLKEAGQLIEELDKGISNNLTG